MSDATSEVSDVPAPREQQNLFGHADAEREMLDGYASGRLHHAWLIGGPSGIGKATLAYRFARFLLSRQAGRDDRPRSLAVDPASRAARQVAALSHPDLLVLDPELLGRDKEPARSIPVEAVRRVVSFFGSTASDGGFRIAIVDSAEDLTNSSANALLKAIEEPPPRSLFLIVSHAPQRVIPTIRSRCRKLTLRPLVEDDLRAALAGAGAGAIGRDRLARAIALAEGSVRHAIEMLDPDKTGLLAEVTRLLDALPATDPRQILALADKLATRQKDEAYGLVLDAVQSWLSGALQAKQASGPARLIHLAEASARIAEDARTIETYNLDRRPFVVALFGNLAEAVKRAG